jgi:hypothetical protein
MLMIALILLTWYLIGYFSGLATMKILHGSLILEDLVWAGVFAFLGPAMAWVAMSNLWYSRCTKLEIRKNE